MEPDHIHPLKVDYILIFSMLQELHPLLPHASEQLQARMLNSLDNMDILWISLEKDIFCKIL